MKNNRRQFLKLSALAATGLVLPMYSCGTGERAGGTAASTASEAASKEALDRFGIQLWTVKEEMAKNPKEVLSQLASYGYKQIESFEGQQGMFWGMSNTEFKDYVDSIGMSIISSHANVKENLDQKAEQAAAIGMQYLISPYEGAQESLDDWKRMAERFNRDGETCRKHGLRFAYHNHGYTFVDIEGETPQKVLLENTDPDLVDFEMDIYWVVTAGADPEEYLRQYPNRFRLGHLKDRKEDAAPDEREASTILGTGAIDYERILSIAKENGMEYYIYEQERFDKAPPLAASERSADYLKDLKF